jgi:hypothetical protein
MSRKHYKAIAAIMADYRESIVNGHEFSEYQKFEIMLTDLINVFAADNPNFDSIRFVKATQK